jgi:hypothetical protein
MRLLVVHRNFSGQFRHLVKEWSRRPGWDVRGLGRDTVPGLPGFAALTRYKLARQGHTHQHPYQRQMSLDDRTRIRTWNALHTLTSHTALRP